MCERVDGESDVAWDTYQMASAWDQSRTSPSAKGHKRMMSWPAARASSSWEPTRYASTAWVDAVAPLWCSLLPSSESVLRSPTRADIS